MEKDTVNKEISERRKFLAEESARLKEYEERYKAKVKRRGKILLTLFVTALLCFAAIATIALVRFSRYCRASERFTAGEYEGAAEAFMEMDDYKDSRLRVYRAAIELYRLKQYEEALPYFVWLDGYPDSGYYLRKCQEHLGLEP